MKHRPLYPMQIIMGKAWRYARARLAPQAKAYMEAAAVNGVAMAEEGEYLTHCAKAMMSIITASFDSPDTGFPNFCDDVQLKALAGVEELLSMAIFFHQIEADLRKADHIKVDARTCK